MERKAPEYGNLLHVAARTPDGVLVLNLWESEEGSEQAFQDPEIQEARQAMMDSGAAAGPPEITHYEVVDYRPSMGWPPLTPFRSGEAGTKEVPYWRTSSRFARSCGYAHAA